MKNISVFINNRPKFNIKIEKNTSIKDVKKKLRGYIILKILINNETQLDVLYSNKYDKVNFEEIWDEIDDPKIYLEIPEYKIVSILGKGSSSSVFSVKDKFNDLYAMKRVYKNNKYYHLVQKELEIYNKLKHPNIVQLIANYDTNFTTIMIMEKGEKDLYEWRKTNTLNKCMIKKIMLDVSSAIKYLHDKNYVHRDIKPENILKFDTKWKLADFGFTGKERIFHGSKGTDEFLAPEISTGSYKGKPTDIWSLGVTLYELDQSCLPIFPIKIRSKFKYLLRAMLTINPSDRITINDVILTLEKI